MDGFGLTLFGLLLEDDARAVDKMNCAVEFDFLYVSCAEGHAVGGANGLVLENVDEAAFAYVGHADHADSDELLLLLFLELFRVLEKNCHQLFASVLRLYFGLSLYVFLAENRHVGSEKDAHFLFSFELCLPGLDVVFRHQVRLVQNVDYFLAGFFDNGVDVLAAGSHWVSGVKYVDYDVGVINDFSDVSPVAFLVNVGLSDLGFRVHQHLCVLEVLLGQAAGFCGWVFLLFVHGRDQALLELVVALVFHALVGLGDV